MNGKIKKASRKYLEKVGIQEIKPKYQDDLIKTLYENPISDRQEKTKKRLVGDSLEKLLTSDFIDESGSKESYIEHLTKVLIANTIANGTIKDLKAIAEILGELDKAKVKNTLKISMTDNALKKIAITSKETTKEDD